MSKTITVDGIKYVPIDTSAGMELICVDNRGLLFAGYPEAATDDGYMSIRDARCVIRWGTSGHVAELAEAGPLANTKLGTSRDVTVRVDNVQYRYKCSGAWSE